MREESRALMLQFDARTSPEYELAFIAARIAGTGTSGQCHQRRRADCKYSRYDTVCRKWPSVVTMPSDRGERSFDGDELRLEGGGR